MVPIFPTWQKWEPQPGGIIINRLCIIREAWLYACVLLVVVSVCEWNSDHWSRCCGVVVPGGSATADCDEAAQHSDHQPDTRIRWMFFHHVCSFTTLTHALIHAVTLNLYNHRYISDRYINIFLDIYHSWQSLALKSDLTAWFCPDFSASTSSVVTVDSGWEVNSVHRTKEMFPCILFTSFFCQLKESSPMCCHTNLD